MKYYLLFLSMALTFGGDIYSATEDTKDTKNVEEAKNNLLKSVNDTKDNAVNAKKNVEAALSSKKK